MTDSTHNSRRRGRSLPAIIVMVVLLGAVAGALAYYVLIETPLQARLADGNNMLVRLSGLQNPVNHRLDSKYVDAEGDLVADAPSDPAQQIDPPRLTFSYVPAEGPMESEYKQAFADLMAHISKATGKPVVYFDAASSDEQLRAVRMWTTEPGVTSSKSMRVLLMSFCSTTCLFCTTSPWRSRQRRLGTSAR